MLQRNATTEEILEVMTYLNLEELGVIRQYVRGHYAQVMERDRRIRERAAIALRRGPSRN